MFTLMYINIGHLWISYIKDYYFIAPICSHCNQDPEKSSKHRFNRAKKNTKFLKIPINDCIYING